VNVVKYDVRSEELADKFGAIASFLAKQNHRVWCRACSICT